MDYRLSRFAQVEARVVKPTVAEEQLLELLLVHEELRNEFLPKLVESDYDDLPTAAIFRALIEIHHEGSAPDLDTLSAKLNQDYVFAIQLLPRLLMSEESIDDDKKGAARVAAEKCFGCVTFG